MTGPDRPSLFVHRAKGYPLSSLPPPPHAVVGRRGYRSPLRQHTFTCPLMVEWRALLSDDGALALCMCGSFAKRVEEPAFQKRMLLWHAELGTNRLATLVGIDSVAARTACLPPAFVSFVKANEWTQRMSWELCRRVPLRQTTAVEESVWVAVYNETRRR